MKRHSIYLESLFKGPSTSKAERLAFTTDHVLQEPKKARPDVPQQARKSDSLSSSKTAAAARLKPPAPHPTGLTSAFYSSITLLKTTLRLTINKKIHQVYEIQLFHLCAWH